MTVTLTGFGSLSSAGAFDNGLVTPGDALLPSVDGLVTPGDIRAGPGYRPGTKGDEPSIWNKVPVPERDGASSFRTASLAVGDGSSSLVGDFVPLADRDERDRCQHDRPGRCVLPVLPSGSFILSQHVSIFWCACIVSQDERRQSFSVYGCAFYGRENVFPARGRTSSTGQGA